MAWRCGRPGYGASVIVCEVDPLRALEARMEGFAVMPALRAAEVGDIFITVTGVPDVLRGEHFFRMKDGAVLANAGQFDVEISLHGAAGRVLSAEQILPLVERFAFGDRYLHLVAGGRVVNLAAAEGHPAAVMDVSFALEALAAEALVRGTWTPGVHAVPDEIEREVASLKLAALDVDIDQLTDAQTQYLTLTSPRRDR